MTELDKLEKYLKEKGYNYERTQTCIGIHSGDQLIVYDENGDRQWDAIYNWASYGHEEGLLEIMGTITQGPDSVEGWLTAADIIERLEKRTATGRTRNEMPIQKRDNHPAGDP